MDVTFEYCFFFVQKQDILQNSLSMYGNDMGMCNGNVKLGCISPSEQGAKRMKSS